MWLRATSAEVSAASSVSPQRGQAGRRRQKRRTTPASRPRLWGVMAALLDPGDHVARSSRRVWPSRDADVVVLRLFAPCRPVVPRNRTMPAAMPACAAAAGAGPAYSRSAIMAASAKVAVPAMIRPADARPTISPQRRKGSPCCGYRMACCPCWPAASTVPAAGMNDTHLGFRRRSSQSRPREVPRVSCMPDIPPFREASAWVRNND